MAEDGVDGELLTPSSGISGLRRPRGGRFKPCEWAPAANARWHTEGNAAQFSPAAVRARMNSSTKITGKMSEKCAACSKCKTCTYGKTLFGSRQMN